MNAKRLQAIGVVLGVALFVMAGLLVFAGAVKDTSDTENTKPPIADGHTAALRALGDTFGEIADRVGPSVVTVYSEKVVKFQRPDFSFPFGETRPSNGSLATRSSRNNSTRIRHVIANTDSPEAGLAQVSSSTSKAIS